MPRARPRFARALGHRNYRLYLIGQGTSLIGTWLTKFAISWMAYRLTGSPFMLGVVAFCNNAPSLLLGPLAGVMVDRWNRQRTILVTQVLAGLQSAALAVFALTGWMTVWHLMLLGSIQGAINAFDMPARQSFVRELLDDRADLPNAIAINSSMVNVAKMLGPVIAAALVALVGEGWCFAIDAASYIAVVASLVAIRVTTPSPTATPAPFFTQFAAGLRYVRTTPFIRALLLLIASISLLAGAYASMMPIVAARHLGGGPSTLGILLGAAGLGALTGALYLAHRETVVGLGGVIARTSLVLGASLVGLELAPTVWLAAPLLYLLGLCLMIQMAATNTIIQTIVDPSMLGRVMSLYAMAVTGGLPIGAFLHGTVASHLGAIHTLALAGLLVLAASAVFRHALPELRRTARPRYVELGLIRG